MFFKIYHHISTLSVFFLISAVCSKISSDCGSQTDCGSCLQQFDCVWCIQPKVINSLRPNNRKELNHCVPRSSAATTCSKEDIVDPKTGSNVTANQPLRSASGNIIQITPQEIDLSLRVRQTINVTFQYAQAENYPVDLYYIIDNSFSMKEHKKKLSKLGTKLTETMVKLTNDFRIGFGSFIDKIDLPFVSTVPHIFKRPCTGCVSPYDFKNHLPLTSNFSLFSQEVEKADVSGNQDAPEGGFDAIVQAIVCTKEIGWRPQARHFVMFSSDAEFHIAGDGKLAGIIETNDAKCHMENDEYQGLQKDYPSISHLNYIIKENNVNIIFAIVKAKREALNSYQELSKHISNSVTDGLDENSNNVVQLVVENYKKIVSAVTLEANSTQNIQVELTPHCKNPIRNGCAKVGLGEVVSFTASITLLDCAEYSVLPTIISIKPDAINESLVLRVNPVCSCPCESGSHPSFQSYSEKCKGKGDLVCGVCKCNKGYHGTFCECDKESPILFNDSNCKETNNSKPCSGRGLCRCGRCECSIIPSSNGTKYSGKFCDCDDTSCYYEKGRICNGQGECRCGKCECFAGWSGSSCECPDKKEMCMKGEKDKEVCSGKGTCECGRCHCEGKYTGTYCDLCQNCTDECQNIRPCVECKIFQTGPYDRNQCAAKCFGYDIKTTNEVKKTDDDEKICRMKDQKKCEVAYKYKYDPFDDVTIVTVQKEKNCDPNILVWVIAVMGLVLFIGFITLLIWKIATLIHDSREYAEFMHEQKNSKWHRGENPLYKGATTTFHNPHFEH